MDTKTDTNKSGLILSKERLSHWLTSTTSVQQRRDVERSLKQRELFSCYPDPALLLADYNPSIQAKIVKTGFSFAALAKNEAIPTLGLLSGTYGEETPLEWLKIQIGSLNDYAEQGRGITENQLTELTSLVLNEYYYLNLAEVANFIARFKLGYYGEFYGVIGPMKIASAIREYLRERSIDIERYEREQERIQGEKNREEWAKTSITHEEYLRRKESRKNGK